MTRRSAGTSNWGRPLKWLMLWWVRDGPIGIGANTRSLWRSFADHSVKLGGRGLIDAATILQLEDAHRLEQAQRAETVGVGRVLRLLERHRDMTLCGEIVDFVRLDFLDHAHETGRIGEVTVMQGQGRAGFVKLAVQVIDALGIE